MITGENGILQKATEAKEQTGIGQEKEIVALAYNSALAKKINNGDSTAVTAGDLNAELVDQGASAEDGDNQIIVTFENEHKYSIDSKSNIEQYTPPTFPLAEDILITNSSASVDSEKSPYVNYIDKNGNTILCRVLYDSTSTSTDGRIEIISANSLTSLFFGYDDEKASISELAYTGSKLDENSKKAIASYNRAITTLNEKAEEYLDVNGIADRARCVGSSPKNPTDIFGMYSNSVSYYSSYKLNNLYKNTDNSYVADFGQMNALDLREIGENYWLASRYVYVSSDNRNDYLRIRYVYKGMSSISVANVIHLWPRSGTGDPINTAEIRL